MVDDWFGDTGKALDWLKSYLTGRCQRIKLRNCPSSKAELPFVVPHWSVPCPLRFSCYTTPLSTLQILMLSFRSQDVRSHPWVGRLRGDIFGNQRSGKVNESSENSVIWFGSVALVKGHLISSELLISSL